MIHTAICDWLQLDPAHYEAMEIESLGNNNYRLGFLDGSVSDWKFIIEDGVVLDGYCFNDII